MVIKDRTEISSPLHPSLVLSSVKTISTRCWWSLIFRHGRQRHQTQTGADPHFGGHHHSLQSRTSRILRDVPVIHVGAEGMRYVYFLFILRVYGLTKHDTRSRQLTWRGFEKGTLCLQLRFISGVCGCMRGSLVDTSVVDCFSMTRL
jgi:hypothetical protein